MNFHSPSNPAPPSADASSDAFHQRACFIAGSAKSGTTLLMSLLDGHPELLPLPEETAYFPTVRRKYLHSPRATQARYLMETAETRLLFEKDAVDYGNRDYREFPRHALREHFLAAVLDPNRKNEDMLALLAESYAAVLKKNLDEIRWWLEKTPANRWCVDDIRTVYPASRILVTMRDPRAVTAAIIQRAKSRPRPGFSIYLAVKYWLQSARLAWKAQNSPHVHVVRFEELLTEPEQTMRQVSAFLGVTYLPCLQTPTKAGVAWKGNTTGGTSFAGIDTTPIRRWEKQLTPSELAFIESLAGPWMERLGYPPTNTPRTLRAILRKQPLETFRDYTKDRRRWIGDALKGFWKLDE
jgi:hypothetical protein